MGRTIRRMLNTEVVALAGLTIAFIDKIPIIADAAKGWNIQPAGYFLILVALVMAVHNRFTGGE